MPSLTTPQLVAFASLYASYVAAYIAKKNYGYWLNQILERGDLTITQAAVFGSTMELAYGAGKLAAGPVADNAPPKALLLASLTAAALANAGMFATGVYAVDVALWGVNGFAQAFAWPALAIVFFNWFGTSPVRGTLYSVLSTNQNVGSAVTPILLTPLVAAFGWRAALWAPALIGLATVLGLVVLLDERPRVSAPAAAPSATTPAKTASQPQPDPSNWTATVRRMLTSPDIWFLGAGYSFVTLVRVAVSDWALVFVTSKDFLGLPAETARDCLVALEVGGFVGGLAAGAVSDAAFRGRRGPVMVLFSGLIASPAVFAVFLGPRDPLILRAAFAALGFGAFGPHVLVGLVARELFPEAPSTAGSFAKSLAQVGGSLAGVPVSVLAQRAGWESVGAALTAAMVAAALCFAPLLRFGAVGGADAKTKRE